MNGLSFGAPAWFWALALLPVLLALFFWNENRRGVLLRQLVAARLQPELTASVSARKRRVRFALLLAGLACVIVALAQPRLGYTFEQSHRQGRDVLIAIDVSKSMLATDVAPSRLERAKLAAQDLVSTLPGDRVGLIAFAGTAFLQAPLTIDYSAVLASVNELDTDVIPSGGTDIAAAIRMAAEAFGKGESSNRALVLFTDGEELEESAVEAARAQAGNFRIFTVGVGTKEGSLIPMPDERGGTAFVKDERGEYVKSRLDENRLSEIAQASGGFYVLLGSGPATMKTILEQGLGKMEEREIDARQSRRPIERYQWPLAAGLALLAGSLLVGERRRVRERQPARVWKRASAAAAAALFLFMSPLSAWCRNSGVELYEQQNYKGALDTFQKQLQGNPNSDALHYDAGAAAYKTGDYDRALEAFSRATTASDPSMRAKAEYNLANTLVQRGAKQSAKEQKLKEWRNALQHYDEALKTDAKNEDAKYNRDLVKKLMEDMQKQQPPEQQDKEQKPDQDSKDDQKKDPQHQNNSQKNDQQKPSDQSKAGEKKDSQQEQSSGKSQDERKDQAGEKSAPEKGGQGDKKQESKESGEQKEANQQNDRKPADRKTPDDRADNSDEKNARQQDEKQSENAEAKASPQPSPGGQKLTGDIQPQGEPKDEPTQKADAAAARAASAPERPGEMSEAQARALIDSLKGEDEHVSLQERKRAAAVLKDW